MFLWGIAILRDLEEVYTLKFYLICKITTHSVVWNQKLWMFFINTLSSLLGHQERWNVFILKTTLFWDILDNYFKCQLSNKFQSRKQSCFFWTVAIPTDIDRVPVRNSCQIGTCFWYVFLCLLFLLDQRWSKDRIFGITKCF